MLDKKLSKILICGFGSIGQRHFKLVRNKLPECKISLLRSGYGQKTVEEHLAENIFFDIEKSISWEPNAVIISSPANMHVRHALPFLKLGIPALIEKPLSCTNESKSSLDKLRKYSYSVPILLGYVFRHDPGVIALKKSIDEGFLGDITALKFICSSWLPNWRPNTDYKDTVSAKEHLGGGVLLELSHEIDLALWLSNEKWISVESEIKNSGLLDISVEDNVKIKAKCISNKEVKIFLDFCSKKNERLIIIDGTKGSIKLNLINGSFEFLSNMQSILRSNYYIGTDERMSLQLNHFLDCCRKSANPKVNIDDGIMVLDIIKACKEANGLDLNQSLK